MGGVITAPNQCNINIIFEIAIEVSKTQTINARAFQHAQGGHLVISSIYNIKRNLSERRSTVKNMINWSGYRLRRASHKEIVST